MILLIDNYDSFVFNLARYFERLGQPTLVVRNDAVDVAGVRKLRPSAVALSPGPCTPSEAGCSLDLVRELHRDVPILGVCLGHQAIAQAFGAPIVRAAEPVHGRTSPVYHNGQGLFEDLDRPMQACRYHSLVVARDGLPDELTVTATLDDGTIMGLKHRRWTVYGVQFHPESVLTNNGYRLIANFLRLAGFAPPTDHAHLCEEFPAQQAVYVPPEWPVTF